MAREEGKRCLSSVAYRPQMPGEPNDRAMNMKRFSAAEAVLAERQAELSGWLSAPSVDRNGRYSRSSRTPWEPGHPGRKAQSPAGQHRYQRD
jgi:hypothetical protein